METQLSWIFLWLFLIIPNYSSYAHNPSRFIGHSLENQLPQKKSNRLQNSCTGPDDHCPLRFRIGQRIPGWWWKERVVFCCLCLSALQLGIIRIIKIIVIIGIIGIIEIIIKILPEHQALGAALRDGWTPRATLGSSLPVHDEIPIPDRYMPQANVSEAEPHKQAMWNGRVKPQKQSCKNFGLLSSGGNSAAETHS